MNSDRAVLRALLAHGPATRPALAERTGLSKPTVSEAIRRLTVRGVVTESGRRTGQLGRAPYTFAIHPDAGRVVGVDIGGSFVRAMLTDVQGRPLGSVRSSTPRGTWPSVVQRIDDLIHELVHVEEHQAPILAMGVSTTGVIAPDTRKVSYAYAIGQGEEYDLLDALHSAWPVPILLENNVNCAALGEHWRGRARGVRDLAFVSVGAGVGLGLLKDGRVLSGSHGAAGEIAFLPLTEGGGHPRRGAFEERASASGVLDLAQRRGGWPGEIPRNVEEIFDLAVAGYPTATAIVAEVGQLIGDAVVALCAVVDPEIVVFGGGLGGSPVLFPFIEERVNELFPYPPRMERTELAAEASLFGAVALGLRSAHAGLLASSPA